MHWLLCNILFLVWTGCTEAYFITVDAHAEECFFDKAECGTKMDFTFEIAEGGFLDIDVTIIGPDRRVIYQGHRERNGRYIFAAHLAGTYTYCFGNQMSTMTPKLVMFNMHVGDAPTRGSAASNAEGQEGDASNHGKLENMIRELTSSLTRIKLEQEYMQVRDRVHHSVNESTNSRVVAWSFFEAFVLVCMTLGQVYYSKRFSDVSRVV